MRAAEISLPAIRHNVRTIRERANGAALIAVVKANGYGHGAAAAAQAAVTQYELAAAEFKRFQELRAQGFISAWDLERRESQLKATKAQAEQEAAAQAAAAQQAQQQAQAQRSYSYGSYSSGGWSGSAGGQSDPLAATGGPAPTMLAFAGLLLLAGGGVLLRRRMLRRPEGQE